MWGRISFNRRRYPHLFEGERLREGVILNEKWGQTRFLFDRIPFFFFDPRIKIGIIIGLLVLSYPGRDYRYSEYKNRCYPVIFSFFTYMR